MAILLFTILNQYSEYKKYMYYKYSAGKKLQVIEWYIIIIIIIKFFYFSVSKSKIIKKKDNYNNITIWLGFGLNKFLKIYI